MDGARRRSRLYKSMFGLSFDEVIATPLFIASLKFRLKGSDRTGDGDRLDHFNPTRVRLSRCFVPRLLMVYAYQNKNLIQLVYLAYSNKHHFSIAVILPSATNPRPVSISYFSG